MRGGQRQKAKRAAQKQRDEHGSESIEELCRRLVNLRLGDDTPEQHPTRSLEVHSVPITKPSSALSPDSVRHHWAPRFRPNGPPTPPPEVITTTTVTGSTPPLQLPKPALSFGTINTLPQSKFLSGAGTELLGTTELKGRYAESSKLPKVEYIIEETDSRSSLVFPSTIPRQGTDKFDFNLAPLANPLPA